MKPVLKFCRLVKGQPFTKQSRFLATERAFENIVGKGENAGTCIYNVSKSSLPSGS